MMGTVVVETDHKQMEQIFRKHLHHKILKNANNILKYFYAGLLQWFV